MIGKVNRICYNGMPEIELPREICLPDEEDANLNWRVTYELVKAWKEDLEELEKIKSQVEVDMDIYDTEEIHENCTVQIWSNSQTGKISIGWWKNE